MTGEEIRTEQVNVPPRLLHGLVHTEPVTAKEVRVPLPGFFTIGDAIASSPVLTNVCREPMQ